MAKPTSNELRFGDQLLEPASVYLRAAGISALGLLIATPTAVVVAIMVGFIGLVAGDPGPSNTVAIISDDGGRALIGAFFIGLWSWAVTYLFVIAIGVGKWVPKRQQLEAFLIPGVIAVAVSGYAWMSWG